MTFRSELKSAVKQREIKLHTVDFDCLLCKRSFNFTKTSRLSPAAFVLAHLKQCRLSRRPV